MLTQEFNQVNNRREMKGCNGTKELTRQQYHYSMQQKIFSVSLDGQRESGPGRYNTGPAELRATLAHKSSSSSLQHTESSIEGAEGGS